MGYQNSSDRQMFQGNWTCSECGAAITELPFEPKSDQPLYCRSCHSARRGTRVSSGPRAPRQMYQGNWQCSECGAPITELPFMPNGVSPLYCRDCHQARRNNRE